MLIFDTILDLIPFGLVVVTRRGEVVLSNAVALELLTDAGPLVLKDGMLAAKSAVYQRALDEATERVGRRNGSCRSAGFSMARQGLPPICVSILPIKHQTSAPARVSSGKVLVLVFDPLHHLPMNSDLIAELFDFTPAEALIASHLLNGEEIRDVALKLKLSTHTVRNHLKRLYLKTNTNKHWEFLHVLLRSPAGLRHHPTGGTDRKAAHPIEKAFVVTPGAA
jgi:DNA-binding CsgD family transcriptional regulator